MGSFSTVLTSEGFMPHGHCYLWTPGLLWTNVISDSLIGLAYFSIPLTLIYFVQKKRDVPFNWMFVAFGIFILACGATHVMDVWTTWNPSYWLSGFIKVITAAASVPTAILLVRLVPQALAMPSPQQLAKVNAELTNEIGERKRVEQELQREEERFRNTLEHAPIGMAIVALHGEFVQVNRALCAIVDYEKGELEKLTFQAITHPDDLEADLANVGQLLRGEVDSYQMEKRYVRKDGRIVWVQLTASLVRDDKGNPIHFIAQVQDITKRRQADEELRRSEERSRLSEARLQAFMNNSPSVMFIKDLEGRYVHVNERFAHAFGLERQGIISRTDAQIFPPEQAAQFQGNDAKVLAARTPLEIEETAQYGDGLHTSLVCKFPILDGNGRITALGGIVTDITDRRQAELALQQANAFLDSVFDHIPDMLFVKDAKDLTFVRFNKAGADLIGCTPADLVGKSDYDFFPPDQAEFFTLKDRETLAGGVLVDIPEEPIATKNHGVRTMHARKIPIAGQDGTARYLLGISEDITERKQAEREIRKLNEDLRCQTAELIAANKEMEAFSYSVAHDLRAPLRQVLGFSKILTEEYGPQLSADARRYLDQVQGGAQHMGQLVDALLGLAKLGRQALLPQVTPLNAILQTVLEELQPECLGRNIEWQVGELFSVECDTGLLKQVFVNLLSNALKYTRPRDRAVIAVGHAVVDHQPVVFVRDNGVGFDMRYAGKLFGLFERLHKAQDFEGTGVGLATVERIIRRHAGRIWAEAEPDRGATFFFTIGSIVEYDDRTGVLEIAG